MSFTIKTLFSKVGITGLSINPGFMNIEFDLKEADKDAAWEMYSELITRVSTQKMQDGKEKAALDSLYKLFEITRGIIKKNGRACFNFTRVAVIILNQIIRPFTSKWHEILQTPEFEERREEFRKELMEVQDGVKKYAKILAEMAGVDDITELEE